MRRAILLPRPDASLDRVSGTYISTEHDRWDTAARTSVFACCRADVEARNTRNPATVKSQKNFTLRWLPGIVCFLLIYSLCTAYRSYRVSVLST